MYEEFRTIYSLYHDMIYRYLLKLVNFDEDMAEELTQETFYQVMISFHKFRGECKVETWICQIAKNITYKQFRKNPIKRLGTIQQEQVSEDVLANPEQYIEKQEINQYVRACIFRIKKKYRDVIIYRMYYELSYTEIASIMQTNENVVRVNFHRGKELLRKEMEEYIYGG